MDRHGFREGVFLYIIFMAVNVIGSFGYRYTRGNALLTTFQSFGMLAIMLVVVLVMRRRGHPFFSIGHAGVALKKIWPVWVIALATALVAANMQHTFGNHSLLWYAWLSLGVVLAPITEEFVFRGAIQTSLNNTTFGSRSIIGLRCGTLLSAIMFSCAHFTLLVNGVAMPRVLFEVFSALPLALAAGYIYQRTSNIWYGVFLHGLGNLGGA